MKKTMSVMAAGLLLLAASPASAEPQIPAAYVAIGDSLAAGQPGNRQRLFGFDCAGIDAQPAAGVLFERLGVSWIHHR